MHLGVFTPILRHLPLGEALDLLRGWGVPAVELGSGGYPGTAHCAPAELLASRERRAEWQAALTSRGLRLSSLSCHGNPLHPRAELATRHREDFRSSVRLAAEVGCPVVTTFSGCPGDHPGALHPNWVAYYWPPDFQEILAWQWEEVALPYWREEARFAADHGVKIALEPHPGFLVYNPETMLRLREAAGETVGVNFDPSHFFWQGINPLQALLCLAGAVHHVHAKDTGYHPVLASRHGLLDTRPSGEFARRSWIFRTVGYGHGEEFWRGFVSTLRLIGYEGAISIEHEDPLMTPHEGLEKAVRFLQGILLHEPR